MSNNNQMHTTSIVEMIYVIELNITWHIPMFILTPLLGQRRAARITSRIRKYFWSISVGKLLHATVFKRRPCKRVLKYVGCNWCPEKNPDDHPHFKLGKTYTSTSFNNITYSIENYDGLIGCSNFEVIRKISQ